MSIMKTIKQQKKNSTLHPQTCSSQPAIFQDPTPSVLLILLLPPNPPNSCVQHNDSNQRILSSTLPLPPLKKARPLSAG